MNLNPTYLYLFLAVIALLVVGLLAFYTWKHHNEIETEAEDFYDNTNTRFQAAEAKAKSEIGAAEQYAETQVRRRIPGLSSGNIQQGSGPAEGTASGGQS